VLKTLKEAYENACPQGFNGSFERRAAGRLSVNEPPTNKGKKLKVYYSVQASANPPPFVIFVNDETIMHFSTRDIWKTRSRKPLTSAARHKN
jgi:GTP-binding protein